MLMIIGVLFEVWNQRSDRKGIHLGQLWRTVMQEIYPVPPYDSWPTALRTSEDLPELSRTSSRNSSEQDRVQGCSSNAGGSLLPANQQSSISPDHKEGIRPTEESLT